MVSLGVPNDDGTAVTSLSNWRPSFVPFGARIAEPGEFTERAVLNGKLDLVQAESIGNLINARTPLQASADHLLLLL